MAVMILARSEAEAVNNVRTHLRVNQAAAAGLVNAAREHRDGLEVVAEIRLVTSTHPKGWSGGASRWLLTWTPAGTQMKLTRLAKDATPRERPQRARRGAK